MPGSPEKARVSDSYQRSEDSNPVQVSGKCDCNLCAKPSPQIVIEAIAWLKNLRQKILRYVAAKEAGKQIEA